MVRLVLVLGDQLSHDLSALRAADPTRDIVVMAEVAAEAEAVPHHPKKIAFLFAAMRKFAASLQDQGWQVAYTRLDDPQNTGSIQGELIRRAAEYSPTGVIWTEAGDWRLNLALQDLPSRNKCLPDRRFICSTAEFSEWAEGRKSLRMEYFYREMRRKTGLLMDGDQPVGGRWNFDADNRKPPPDSIAFSGPLKFTPDDVTLEVLGLVADRFGHHFGDLLPFWYATDRDGALAQLDHWIAGGLAGFGDHQDAMLSSNRFLNHSILSAYLNAGLLTPIEICQRVEGEWRAGRVPINAAEGFIRQIIGWREYVRGVYFLKGPDYTKSNILRHDRPLPAVYWGGKTGMACMQAAVTQTRQDAYAHHIQRLMVTGNFGLLAGISPQALHEWYLSVYIDAFEWAEAPNTIGMSQFADGGVVASKPYVSSGAYINRMSDYCRGCAYDVTAKTGDTACPFNLLYWHFLTRHRDRFAANPRMGQMYRTWDKMAEPHKTQVLQDADTLLARLDAGDPV